MFTALTSSAYYSSSLAGPCLYQYDNNSRHWIGSSSLQHQFDVFLDRMAAYLIFQLAFIDTSYNFDLNDCDLASHQL